MRLRTRPNHALQPTQHFVISCRFMHALIFKVLGG